MNDYMVSFDATYPIGQDVTNRKTAAFAQLVTAHTAEDAVVQVRVEAQRAHRVSKENPAWKNLNGVSPVVREIAIKSPLKRRLLELLFGRNYRNETLDTIRHLAAHELPEANVQIDTSTPKKIS